MRTHRPLLALGGAAALLAAGGAGALLSADHHVPGRVAEVGPMPAPVVATDPPAVTTGGAVDVVLTHAGWHDDPDGVDVEGFVSGVVEDGGTCRVVLTRDDEVVTVEAAAVADASTTVCPPMALDGATVVPGVWQVELSYASSTSTGAAPVAEILVPTR